MTPALGDRWRARRSTWAMHRVLKARGFTRRGKNDWQSTWKREGAATTVVVVVSRLPGAGNAEAEVSRPGWYSGVYVTYDPDELASVL